MNQVRREASDHFPRRRIGRGNRIQCLGLAALSYDEIAAVLAGGLVGDLYFFAGLGRPGSGGRETGNRTDKQEGDRITQTTHIGSHAAHFQIESDCSCW